jgi:predicted  nucleic acid-binding Zn-ribbon protein
LKELQSSGVPTPYRYEFVILVEDGKISEATAHHALRFKRVANNREFFKIEVDEAIQRIAAEIGDFKINWKYTPKNDLTKNISENLVRFAREKIRKLEREIERISVEIKLLKEKKRNIVENISSLRSAIDNKISFTNKLSLLIFGDKHSLYESRKNKIEVTGAKKLIQGQ